MTALLDLTGRTFGRLAVLDRQPGHRRVTWRCRCTCGQEKPVKSCDLTKRHGTKSCGCLQRERAVETRTTDLVGRRFGLLIAERRDGNIRESAAWVCRCDCGGSKRVSADLLTRGDAGSCGCARLTGQVVRPPAARARQAARARVRRKTDVRYKLTCDVRRAFKSALSEAGAVKRRATFDLLGYTPADLQRRLQDTMPPGFTWGDYLAGRLHIDHVRPLASFTFRDETDPGFLAAWALSNLQLLTVADNLAKGARYLGN